uniref:Uncharacterized protein n=1 Tax=Nymphaea colorata TaxID=210225 RepID=A0A5K0XEZ7_9MAGN
MGREREIRIIDSPDGEEGIAVQVPRLDAALVVFEDDLHKVTVRALQDGRAQGQRSGRRDVAGIVHDGCIVVYLLPHAKVLGQLQWSGRPDVGYAVNAVPELPVGVLASGVKDLDGAGDVDLAVVVGALGVWPGRACRQVPPEGAELVERPSNADRSRWQHLRGRLFGVRVADQRRGVQHVLGEPGGSNHEVVAGLLVGGDEHGVALTQMHVQRVVYVLNRVRPFYLHELHSVALHPDIEGRFHADIADPVSVRLPCFHAEHDAFGFSLAGLSINENSIGLPDGLTDLQRPP